MNTLPEKVIERDGPFREFKQDGAIVTVELQDGTTFEPVLLIHPNIVGAMPDVDSLPFDPSAVVRVYQTESNLSYRSSSDWTFFSEPTEAEQAGDRKPNPAAS